MKNVLIVDRDPFICSLFTGLLKSQSGFLNVLSAKNGAAALEVVGQEPVQVVIIGLNLSELEGFELVSQLAKNHPRIRVIVFSSGASSMLRTSIRQIATTIHFDHTRDICQLTKRLFTELQIDFGGQVQGISISAFLQMLELEGRSCTLQVTAKGKTGFLFLLEGEPIAATQGPLTGKPAALAILAWKNVVIDIDYTPPDRMREFSESLMNLLLEAGRLDDEKNSQRPDKRRHDRFDCLVAVDYDVSNWTYQCFLRDISLGGAYLETEQAAPLGSRLILTLSAPAVALSCKVQGKVVRHDPKGLAVSFEDLSLKQREVIQALAELRPRPAADPTPSDAAEEPSLELFG